MGAEGKYADVGALESRALREYQLHQLYRENQTYGPTRFH